MMSDLNTSCILCESIADDKYLIVANLDEAKFANWWFENFDVKIEKSVLQDKSGRVCNFCIQDARNSSNSDSVGRENPIDWWTVASCDSSQHLQGIMKKCVVVLERLDEEKVVPSSVASCSSGTSECTASRNKKIRSTLIGHPQHKRRKINEDPCTNCFRYESNTPAVNDCEERKTEHSKQQHTEDLDQGEEDCEIEEQDDLDSKFDDCDYDPYDDGDEDYDPGPDEISCEEDNEVSAVNSTNTKKDRLPEKQACDCLEANKRSPSLFQSCKFCRLDKKHPTTNTTDGENKDIEKSFDRYPAEFRHHVFVLKKSPYTYRGPLCVLCSRVLQFWGEKDARSFCLFCGKLYARVSRHLKHIHQDQQRVSDIKSINDEERRQEAFKQLAREGNYYINNKEAMETKKGFLLPTKKTAVFRHYAAMWHCDSCYTLIDKYNFSRHAESCTQRNEDRAPQPLEGSHEEFVN
ncbi:uncharacterized protein LOC132198783 [Neocloeon triangulifer]|uniref:uncharacterized protein LOC132198783 n=1 Tax=Neocloeon triangulifer TaxID=2078957 RepID=UPI00286F01F5|nr:uncharacterized protein LOC132198783 [Neocloeon triangulifer]